MPRTTTSATSTAQPNDSTAAGQVVRQIAAADIPYLRAILARRNITQKSLAIASGVTPTHLSRVLRGQVHGAETRIRLAEGLERLGLLDYFPAIIGVERDHVSSTPHTPHSRASTHSHAHVFHPSAEELIRALAYALDVPLPLPPPGAPDADLGEEILP